MNNSIYNIELLDLIWVFIPIWFSLSFWHEIGQILSGVDPLIAVRYQMMVMLMILGSAGISVAIYLLLLKPK